MPEQAITAIQAPCVKQPLWMTQQKLTINRGKANFGRKDENSKKEAICMIDQLYPNRRWIRVYTDGSINGTLKKGGAGAYIEWTDKTTTEVSLAVGEMCTSRKAEEKAIIVAVEELKKHENTRNANIVFLTDSDDTLLALENPQPSNETSISQAVIDIASPRKEIVFQWIPGHVGIEGNETADRLAKEGSNKEQPRSNVTYQQQKTLIKQTLAQEWNQKHPDYNKNDPIHLFPRKDQVTIFRLRTGHNCLRQHLHSKLGVGNTPICTCGTDLENTAHILMHCPLYSENRKNFWPSPTTLQTKLYGNYEELRRTADFVANIGVQP